MLSTHWCSLCLCVYSFFLCVLCMCCLGHFSFSRYGPFQLQSCVQTTLSLWLVTLCHSFDYLSIIHYCTLKFFSSHTQVSYPIFLVNAEGVSSLDSLPCTHLTCCLCASSYLSLSDSGIWPQACLCPLVLTTDCIHFLLCKYCSICKYLCICYPSHRL